MRAVGGTLATQQPEQDSRAAKHRRLSTDAKLAASLGTAAEQPAVAEPTAGGLYHDLRPATRIGSASPETGGPLAAAAAAATQPQMPAAMGGAAPRAAWPMDVGAKHRKV